MQNLRREDLEYPLQFWKIIVQSAVFYKTAFFSYLLISALSYLPFLLLDQFGKAELIFITEILHGILLDTIIFLTFPTLLLQKRVFPLATLQIFLQRFFASAVMITLVQLVALVFIGFFIFLQLALGIFVVGLQVGNPLLFLLVFLPMSTALMVVGVIPYTAILFANFFMIARNSPDLMVVKDNLIKSILLTKQTFSPILRNLIKISVLMMIPVMVFSNWYLLNHPEFLPYLKALENTENIEVFTGPKLFTMMENIISEPEFKTGRVSIHILFRPLKSIFLSVLFIGVMARFLPGPLMSFLGLEKRDIELEPTPDNGGDHS